MLPMSLSLDAHQVLALANWPWEKTRNLRLNLQKSPSWIVSMYTRWDVEYLIAASLFAMTPMRTRKLSKNSKSSTNLNWINKFFSSHTCTKVFFITSLIGGDHCDPLHFIRHKTIMAFFRKPLLLYLLKTKIEEISFQAIENI